MTQVERMQKCGRIHVTLSRNNSALGLNLLNEPQIPKNKCAAILTLWSWKWHQMMRFSTLAFASRELFGGMLNMALERAKNSSNREPNSSKASLMKKQSLLLNFASFLNLLLPCLLFKIPDGHANHSSLCETLFLWFFSFLKKNSSNVIGRKQKTTVPKQKWLMLVASAVRNKVPQRRRPLRHSSLLFVSVAMTIWRLATRFSSSLDVLTKVTRCNSFHGQSFAKNDRKGKKEENQKLKRRGRNSSKTLNLVEDRAVLCAYASLHYRSIFKELRTFCCLSYALQAFSKSFSWKTGQWSNIKLFEFLYYHFNMSLAQFQNWYAVFLWC